MEGEITMYNYNPYGFNAQSLLARQEVVRVNGRNGADAYQMAPNSSVLLLDETAPIIWLKTTDGASYPSITGYKITPIETQPVMMADENYSKLEERITRLEGMLDGKSNASDVKPIKTINKSNQ